MSAPLTPDELETLGQVAQRSVQQWVLERDYWLPDPHDYPPSVRAPGAAFVTLRRHGQLRGCIGTLAATQSLVRCVADRARAAAADDPRFTPVQAGELADLAVEVSVLSEPEELPANDYDDLLRRVQPGVDGLIVEDPSHRATLLPSVWDDIASAEEFVAALWRKAGLQPRAWPRRLRMQRYRAQHWPA